MTSSSFQLFSQLERLLPEVLTKFNRYSVADANGNRLLNFAGFKYLLHSCPSLFFRGGDEAQIAALFTQTAAASININNNNNGGGGSTTSATTTTKAAKLNFEAFVAALVSIAKEIFPEDAVIDERSLPIVGGNEPHHHHHSHDGAFSSFSSTLPHVCSTFPRSLLRLLSVHVLPSHSEDPEILLIWNQGNAKEDSHASSSSVVADRLLAKRGILSPSSFSSSSPLISSRNNEANFSNSLSKTSSSSSSTTYSPSSFSGGGSGDLIISMSPILHDKTMSIPHSSTSSSSSHPATTVMDAVSVQRHQHVNQSHDVNSPPILPTSFNDNNNKNYNVHHAAVSSSSRSSSSLAATSAAAAASSSS